MPEQAYKLTDPTYEGSLNPWIAGTKYPWVCSGCWGEGSYDIAALQDIGVLCYVKHLDHEDDPRSALVLLSSGSQGHHSGIIAAFARKPLPSPGDPRVEKGYEKGSDPEGETAYDQWYKYFDPQRLKGERTNYPYLSPVDESEIVGTLWELVYARDCWERFIGHSSMSYRMVDQFVKHHSYDPTDRHESFESWLFGYCGKIMADYEKQFGPLADYGGEEDDKQVGTN